MTIADPDQPAHPCSMIRFYAGRKLNLPLLIILYANSVHPYQIARKQSFSRSTLVTFVLRLFSVQSSTRLQCSPLTESMDTIVYVDEQRLFRSDYVDAHDHLDLHCSHMA